MSEQVIMPKEDWQAILDAVRYGTEKGELLRSDEVASEIMSLAQLFDGAADGSLKTIKNSRLTSILDYAFDHNAQLERVTLPNVTQLGSYAFRYCTNIQTADFSSLTYMSMGAFHQAEALKALIIRTNEVCTLQALSALKNTPIISEEDGYLYVPAALVEEYKLATNWTTIANKIRAIEDYPEITGEAI